MPLCMTAVVTGTNDHPHFAEGWHDRERDGRCGVVYRASRGETRGVLHLRRHVEASVLECLLSGPRGLNSGPLTGTVEVDGQTHPIKLDRDLWVLRAFPLESDRSRNGMLIVRFALEEAPCPDERLGNGDGRRLGWFLAAAWQR